MCRRPGAEWHLKSPPTYIRAASLTHSPTMPQVGLTSGTRHHATSSPGPAAALVALMHPLQIPEPHTVRQKRMHIAPWPVAALLSPRAHTMSIHHRLLQCCMADRAETFLPSPRPWRMPRTIRTLSIRSAECVLGSRAVLCRILTRDSFARDMFGTVADGIRRSFVATLDVDRVPFVVSRSFGVLFRTYSGA